MENWTEETETVMMGKTVQLENKHGVNDWKDQVSFERSKSQVVDFDCTYKVRVGCKQGCEIKLNGDCMVKVLHKLI